MRKYSLILVASILVLFTYSISVTVPGNILKINQAEAGLDLSALNIKPDIDLFVDEETQENATMTASSNNQTTADHVPKFFAIQHAQSGSLSEINETAYSLELNEVSDKTILFSDRPDRIVKSISTSEFIGNWPVGEDSYAIDPPNAVLVVDEQEGQQQDVAVIELFNPVYDSGKMILKYEATPDNATSIELPGEFGQTTIVVDGGGQPPCIPTSAC